MSIAAPVRRISGLRADAIPFDELISAQEPIVMAGIARDWPLVEAGREGPQTAAAYLKRFSVDLPLTVFVGPPDIGGRFHYDAHVTGLNFVTEKIPLGALIDRIMCGLGDDAAPALYAGSTDLDTFLPGLRRENDLPLDHPDFAQQLPLASIWIGNHTIAAAHHDMSNNLACCMVGRRRFTLFPPDQVGNLYPGPLEPTPAGQVVTMVDCRNPDLDRFPGFQEAMAHSQVAELEPGDVLFYPALWWHEVEALDSFNAMINYWWNPVPAYIDTPHTTLLHALLSLRDRPESEKHAWRALFDYYVFGDPRLPGDHLPAAARGSLGKLDEMQARRLRAQILNRMNR